ncbi:hypothetical protein DN752_00545 [Echinicola strongylocentroti]|uniref:Uncharacterized protein n=1 Tax=Echinicola strongylocentroti TaxID=1795355 RepID=A0A2Z4IE95_9BACT|nr:hypothetical protein DN752_00545 [Echinicola strongylocentroti]
MSTIGKKLWLCERSTATVMPKTKVKRLILKQFQVATPVRRGVDRLMHIPGLRKKSAQIIIICAISLLSEPSPTRQLFGLSPKITRLTDLYKSKKAHSLLVRAKYCKKWVG